MKVFGYKKFVVRVEGKNHRQTGFLGSERTTQTSLPVLALLKINYLVLKLKQKRGWGWGRGREEPGDHGNVGAEKLRKIKTFKMIQS